jgi:hypothetical protein
MAHWLPTYDEDANSYADVFGANDYTPDRLVEDNTNLDNDNNNDDDDYSEDSFSNNEDKPYSDNLTHSFSSFKSPQLDGTNEVELQSLNLTKSVVIQDVDLSNVIDDCKQTQEVINVVSDVIEVNEEENFVEGHAVWLIDAKDIEVTSIFTNKILNNNECPT